jgi:hypothetical protein
MDELKPPGRGGRLLAYLIPLALFLAVAAAAPRWISGREEFSKLYDEHSQAHLSIESLRTQQAALRPGQPHVVAVGDSSFYTISPKDYQAGQWKSVPECLQDCLSASPAPPKGLKVLSISRWGYTSRDFLCLCRPIAASRPLAVVIPINLRGLTTPWPASGELDFLLGPAEYAELWSQGQASLKPWAWGLARADWLVAEGGVGLYAGRLLSWYSLRDQAWLEHHSHRVQRPQLPGAEGGAPLRDMALSVKNHYLSPLAPGDAALRGFARLGRELRAEGIRPFFYLVPTDVAAIRKYWGQAGLDRVGQSRRAVLSLMAAQGFPVHDYFALIPAGQRFVDEDAEHYDHVGRQRLAARIARDLCADMGWQRAQP